MGRVAVVRHVDLLLPIGSPELFQRHGSRVRLAPVAHSVQQRPQRLSQRSNGVYHSRWRIRINGTFDDSRALQIAELLRERSLCDSGNSAFQFRKSLGPFKKLLENGAFPAPANNPSSGLHRAEFWELRHNKPSFTLYTM